MGLLSQRFYQFTIAFFITATVWGILQVSGMVPAWFSVCIFKSFTGIPCPGCGTTRAGVALINGALTDAVLINPVALILLLVLGCAALILTTDLVTGVPRLKWLFDQTEIMLKKPVFLIPIVATILINWSWSIVKDL